MGAAGNATIRCLRFSFSLNRIALDRLGSASINLVSHMIVVRAYGGYGTNIEGFATVLRCRKALRSPPECRGIWEPSDYQQ